MGAPALPPNESRSRDDGAYTTALERIALLEKKWCSAEHRANVREWARLRRAYEGDQQSSNGLVPSMPRESRTHFKNKAKFSPNLLAHCVNQLSYTYNEDVIRKVRRGEGINEDAARALEQRWSEVLWDHAAGLTATYDEADPYVLLTGTVALLLQFDDEDPVHPGIDTTWITPERFVAITRRGAPHQVECVAILWGHEPDRGQGHSVFVWQYWDGEYTCWIESRTTGRGWTVIENADGELFHEHGYGAPPVFFMRNIVTKRGEFYGPRLGGADLLPNVAALNHAFTELLAALVLQRGQPWIAGELAPKAQLGLSPEFFIRLRQGGTMGIAPNGANLAGMESGILLMAEAFACGVDLPPDTLRFKSAVVETGRALLIRHGRLREFTKRRRKAALLWERGTMRLAARMWQAHTGEILDPWIDVEYPDAAPILTVQERIAVGGFLLEHGLAPRERVLRMMLSQLSPAESTALLEEAQAEWDKRKAAELAIAGHAGEGDLGDGDDPADPGSDAPPPGTGGEQS